MPPRFGKVTIWAKTPDISVTAWLGQEAPTLSGGYGGWEEVTRPRRTAITQWNGHPPFRLRLPIVFDAFADGDSVEHLCDRLHKLARSPATLESPPIVDIEGAVPKPGIGWVIDGLEWGNSERHPTREYRTRQEVTVQLLQHVPKEHLAKPHTNQPKYDVYTVKQGDTLAKIAAKKLKDWHRWKEIAKINDIRDPKKDKKLKVGRKLKIPRK